MSVAQDDNMTLIAQMLQTDGLPGVLISNRPLRDMSSDVLHHLVHAQTPIYVRHGQLVRVQRREDGTPSIETLTETALKGMLARAMNFVKATAKGPMHIAPPDTIIRDVLSLGVWPFPPLDSIIEFPVFRPDGTLIDTPGYDVVTRLIYAPLPTLTIPQVAENPDWDDIVKALELINEAIGEFPYQNEASHANAIGLLLTPIIRQSIASQVPLALIDATRPGTGKSLLAETVAMIATGRKAAMMTAPHDDDEWRKSIASTLAEGATIIIIDNIKSRLDAASLDAALTNFVVKGRILGTSKNGAYPQRATWMATGNNLQIGGDLPRRSYWIRMDAHTDKPWTRGNFRHDLEEWVPAHRGELIAALLTIARSWFAAGRPQAANIPRMGNFQSWADTVGGILAHTEMVEGFLDNLTALYEQSDNEAAQWAAFLNAWRDLYQEQEIPVSQVAKDIKSGSLDGGDTTIGVAGLYNTLPDDLVDVQKGDFKRRLGRALQLRIGTFFDESGLHLEKARTDKRSGTGYWKVAEVQMLQRPFPQKEEILEENTPLEQAGGWFAEDFSLEKKAKGQENTSATSALLQENPVPEERIEPWTHFKVLDIVFTPKGEGIVIRDWPTNVGVRLAETGETASFERPEDIRKIHVKSDLYRKSYNHQLYSPNVWPYNDPEWTDERLAQVGEPTRAELGFPYPDPRQEGR